jgi:hypothetical protein
MITCRKRSYSSIISFSLHRIFWTGLVTASLSAFTHYSFNIYSRWLDEPIVMTFDDKLAEIYDIPFPAVRNKLNEENDRN